MKAKILLVCKDEKFRSKIIKLVSPYGYEIINADGIDGILQLDNSGEGPQAAIIGAVESAEEKIDIIQALLEQFPKTKPIVVYSAHSLIDVQELYEQGAYRILHSPYEDDLILGTVMEAAPIDIPTDKLTLECLQPVQIGDINPNTIFDFDLFLYLPANKKLLLYRAKNSDISMEQIQKFKKHHFNTLYIRKSEVPAFHRHVAHQIKVVYKSTWLTETERVEKIRREIQMLMAPFFGSANFDIAQSKTVLETCKQVVANFILEITPNPDLYKQILALSSQSYSNYQHAVNVSTFTALFALVLGYRDIEAATLGGLLHDIGISTLESEIAHLLPEQMNQPEKEQYKRHVAGGLDLLQNKKIHAADDVVAIIQQHHEHVDGSGYPQGLKGDQIHPLAKICSIADEFDELISFRAGRKMLSPLAALNSMIASNSAPNEVQKFDKDILDKIVSFLTSNSQPVGLEPVQNMAKRKESDAVPAKEEEEVKLQYSVKPFKKAS